MSLPSQNDQLSISWQDYLETSHRLQNLYPILGECTGSTSGFLRNTGISTSALSVFSPLATDGRTVIVFHLSVVYLMILYNACLFPQNKPKNVFLSKSDLAGICSSNTDFEETGQTIKEKNLA